jgi:hypothetical protein
MLRDGKSAGTPSSGAPSSGAQVDVVDGRLREV